MRQVSSFIMPATDLDADFWSRWGAVRFLGDQFGDRFRLECAFAAALDGLVSPEAAKRITTTREEIERISDELMAAGRRRDGAARTAALARLLVEEVARWCVELELATAHVSPVAVPLAARRLLTRMRVAAAIGR
jgi:hypothetical protein